MCGVVELVGKASDGELLVEEVEVLLGDGKLEWYFWRHSWKGRNAGSR